MATVGSAELVGQREDLPRSLGNNPDSSRSPSQAQPYKKGYCQLGLVSTGSTGSEPPGWVTDLSSGEGRVQVPEGGLRKAEEHTSGPGRPESQSPPPWGHTRAAEGTQHHVHGLVAHRAWGRDSVLAFQLRKQGPTRHLTLLGPSCIPACPLFQESLDSSCSLSSLRIW